jgi:hypothetical protein
MSHLREPAASERGILEREAAVLAMELERVRARLAELETAEDASK